MKKERSNLKKLILILLGISLLLGGTIFIIYKNNKNTKEEVVDIFKEEKEKVKEDKKEDKTTKVIVDIKGMVVNPGVYEVDSTSRVNDVISLAGGLLEGADTSKINLAKVVEDEMTIIIYSTEEVLEKFRKENCVCEKCDITNDACISSTTTDNQLININTADEKELQNILPQSELRPVNYQLNSQQTLYFGGLARLDFITGERTSLVCYFHRRLQIHRTKLEKADELYNRHMTLKPEPKEKRNIQSFKTYQFKLPKGKVDIVISGLGFVTMNCPDAIIEVKTPENVGVFIREALI